MYAGTQYAVFPYTVSSRFTWHFSSAVLFQVLHLRGKRLFFYNNEAEDKLSI